MHIRFAQVGEMLICTLQGEMIAGEGPHFRAELQQKLSKSPEISVVAIDFRRVTRIDSVGIGALTTIHADLTRKSLRKPPHSPPRSAGLLGLASPMDPRGHTL